LLDKGERVVQESRLWDVTENKTKLMRSKEEAHDYRYFPEPDLLPVAIDEEMIEGARAALPELPATRALRLQEALGLSADSAQLLAERVELGDYFEAALASGAEPQAPAQALANWVSGELAARLGEGEDAADSTVTPAALAALVGMLSAGEVSVGAARQVLDRLFADGGGDPRAIVVAEGLAAIGGDEDLAAIVAAALAANEDAAERVREGNAKAIGPIIGHVMRETKGRADGAEVTRLVNEQLGI
jgi:aspartyl-tRNA(Asn)/glutamyl-tRNA(Gln) amidotransferase subunit B